MATDYMNLLKEAWNNWLFNWIKLYASNDLLPQKAVQQLFRGWGGGGRGEGGYRSPEEKVKLSSSPKITSVNSNMLRMILLREGRTTAPLLYPSSPFNLPQPA